MQRRVNVNLRNYLFRFRNWSVSYFWSSNFWPLEVPREKIVRFSKKNSIFHTHTSPDNIKWKLFMTFAYVHRRMLYLTFRSVWILEPFKQRTSSICENVKASLSFTIIRCIFLTIIRCIIAKIVIFQNNNRLRNFYATKLSMFAGK